MNRYCIRYYWSLKEILDPNGDYNVPQVESLIDVYSGINSDGYEMPGLFVYDSESQEWDFASQDIKNLFRLVLNRFYKDYCFSTISSEFSVEKAVQFMIKFFNVAGMTAPKYTKLLSLYSSNDADLMNPVSSSTSGVNRFNDTPQDGGLYDDDDHTTNVTQVNSTTLNDLDTKMGRIKEIEASYRNLLLDWSNEFKPLFIEEGNV